MSGMPVDFIALNARLVSLTELRPFEKNPREHSAAQIENLVAIIRKFGWTIPILIDEDATILAGHGRVLAAERMGIEAVPAITASGWSEEQKRAYIIADNKINEAGGWDKNLLGELLHGLSADGWDMGTLGMSEQDLRRALTGSTSGDGDAPKAEPRPEPLMRPGEVWVLGDRHRLACIDSTNPEAVAKALGGHVPHLMVTDPPYGVNYDPGWREERDLKPLGRVRASGKVHHDDRADWREAWNLFPGDVAYVWHASMLAHEVHASLIASRFELRSVIILVKQTFTVGRGHYHWQHEPCFYVVRKGRSGKWAGGRKESTVWQFANAGAMGGKKDDTITGHGTQKPVEAMRRPIENSSKRGDLIYDPFVGSGTTLVAAEQTGRRAIVCELDPGYAEMALERWIAFANGHAYEESTGETWAERIASREPADEQESEA